MKYTLLLVCLAFAAVIADPPTGTNWAVLVAGSNSYYNYRHQSDICHAFQILKNNGFPNDKIIVFMYDDIANNAQNPHKGEIINHLEGANVYPGVTKDYTGQNCTAANFLAVLAGDKSKVVGGSGRVVNSGPNDNIFVFYSDHGAVGLVAMPVGPYLYAKDLIATLNSMHSNKRYSQLVFYLEACESGSMFASLLPNINIYATTASNGQESSYACYWDATREAYLGDLYSVNWMEDTDASDPKSEDFDTQYQTVKAKTNLSHVMQYGDLDFDNYKLFEFMGFNNKRTATPRLNRISKRNASIDAVDSRDVVIETIKRKLEHATGERKEALEVELHAETARRFKADRVFRSFDKFVRNSNRIFNNNLVLNDNFNWDCYKEAIETYEANCGRFTDYSLKYARNLALMCANGITPVEIGSVASKTCKMFK